MFNREHMYIPTQFGPNYHLDSSGVRVSDWIIDFQDRDWYLEAPNGDIDTVKVIAKMRKSTEGYDEECYCWDPFTSVKFNGHEAPKHPTLKAYDGKRVYIFEK